MNITWVSEIVNIVVFLQSPDWVKMLYVRGHERGNPFYFRYLSRPVKWCFNRESKTYLCTASQAGFFSNKKYDWYIYWTCTELFEAYTFLLENIYVQFDGMVYQQIVWVPMGTAVLIVLHL